MSNRTVIRTVITPRAITRRVGPAGAGGGATTFAALTDKATADLLVNTPLSTALSGKLSITGTAADVNPAGTSIASALSGKQPLDADLTAIAALTTTANGRALLTSPNALSIGTSAYVSGSNTGDHAVNIRYSGLVTNATHTGDVTGSTELTLATVNANVGAWGTSSSTPTFTVDEKGRITEVFEQQTQISVYNVFDMGGGVSTALSIGVDTYGGFLTAGIGDTLPIERGGTGATTAGLARTALGSGATGDELFRATSASVARTTLGIIRRQTTVNYLSSSTTLTQAPELTFPVEAGKTYCVDLALVVSSVAAAGGVQVAMSYPANSVIGSGFAQTQLNFTVKFPSLGATGVNLNTNSTGVPNGTCGLMGWVYLRPTASGNVTFAAGQFLAGTGTVGLLAGSIITIKEL